MNTKQLKQKILDLAIHGKLVPQDPNDEPASVLLERIRAEKEHLIKEGKIKKDKKDSKNFLNDEDRLHYGKFDIPDSWAWCKLNEIGTTSIGLTYKPTDICSAGVPVLRSNNIQNGKLDYSDVIRVNMRFSETMKLQENDILICARNGSKRLVGKCALIPTISEPLTFGAFMAVYRSICSRYIYYFLNTDFFRTIFESEGISTQINQLTQAMIKEALIPLPPIAEQKRIVSAIESAFEIIDEIEKAKSDLQEAVKNAKQKILSLAISGKLVPQNPDDEPASVLLERIQAEKELLIQQGKIKRGKCDSDVLKCDKTPYHVLPKGWEFCRLKDIGLTNIGLTYKPSDICVGGVPVLRSNNIQNGKLDLSELVCVSTSFNKSLELRLSDILICTRNGSKRLVGKCALISYELKLPMTFGAFMAVYRSVCNCFIYHFLNSYFFRAIFQSEGVSTQINQLTQAMIKNTIIPLPPLAEQHRIVEAIEAIFEQLDNILADLI